MTTIERITQCARQLAAAHPELKITYDETMSGHTSFRIGGPVPAMLHPADASQLVCAAAELTRMDVPFRILGKGTNILAGDGALPFAVISTGNMICIEQNGPSSITVQCGATLASAAAFAAERGLAGMEFAHGIPGSLGGAVYMNAGAYGGEMKDIVTSVCVLRRGELITVPAEACAFSYRRSRFTDTDDIIVSALLSLRQGQTGQIRAVMSDLAARRRASQPLDKPSAGSTFKRPATGYAAAMIEQAGLKGYTVGGAAVSEKHSGFVVNLGGATCADVLSVMGHVQKAVYNRFGTVLEPEVKLWT